MRKIVEIVVFVLLLGSACGNDANEGLPTDAVITYQFNDASVPPEYHRSYRITVSKDDASIVVDSYGDVLSQATVDTPDWAWDALSDGVARVAMLESSNAQDGCVGGTSVDVTVLAGSQIVVDLYVPECGGSNDSAGQVVDQWISSARDLFPPMSELVPED